MVRINKQSYDQAVEQLQQSGTAQARQRVWEFIANAPTLFFVQCGSRSCPVPWVMFEDDIPKVMVFTNCQRATQAAMSCIEQSQEVRVVGLPTNAASMYITAIAAQGVSQVCFNHGPQRFDASMDEVLLVVGSMKR